MCEIHQTERLSCAKPSTKSKETWELKRISEPAVEALIQGRSYYSAISARSCSRAELVLVGVRAVVDLELPATLLS